MRIGGGERWDPLEEGEYRWRRRDNAALSFRNHEERRGGRM